MNNRDVIEQFEKTWFYTRQVTNDFLDAIPEDKWEYTHHPKYAILSKQFRHMASVYGVYIEGFKKQAVDFKCKHSHYTSSLSREEIKADLMKKDEELRIVLKEMINQDLSSFKLDFFGVNMGFTEYTHVLIQHECMHIGIWSTMAAFGGFELPQTWKNEWGF